MDLFGIFPVQLGWAMQVFGDLGRADNVTLGVLVMLMGGYLAVQHPGVPQRWFTPSPTYPSTLCPSHYRSDMNIHMPCHDANLLTDDWII